MGPLQYPKSKVIGIWISGEAARMEKRGDFRGKAGGRISGLTRYVGG